MTPLKVGKLKQLLENIPDDVDFVRLADSCGSIYIYIFENQIHFDGEDLIFDMFKKEI